MMKQFESSFVHVFKLCVCDVSLKAMTQLLEIVLFHIHTQRALFLHFPDRTNLVFNNGTE